MAGIAERAAAELPPIIENDDPNDLIDLGEETILPPIGAPVETPEPEGETTDDAAPTEFPATEGEKAEAEKEAAPDPVAEAAKNWNELSQAFTADPVGYVASVMQMMTPTQQATFMQTIAPQQQQAPPAQNMSDVPGWQDDQLTEPERYVKANKAIFDQLPDWSGQVAQTLTTHQQQFQGQAAEIAELKTQIKTLSEQVGVKAKAVATPVPTTPRAAAPSGEGQDGIVTAKAGESFMNTFRRVKAASAGRG